ISTSSCRCACERAEKDRLRLTRIASHSFRNLSPDPVFFGGGTTVIAGENAQGKTNLLEAVALVCGQRSFRRARPQEMAAGEAGFRIEAALARPAGAEPAIPRPPGPLLPPDGRRGPRPVRAGAVPQERASRGHARRDGPGRR